MWSSLEQRGVGLLSEMEGWLLKILKNILKGVQIWNKFEDGPNHLFV